VSDWTDMRLSLRCMESVDGERLRREVLPALRGSRRRRKRFLRDSRAMWQFRMLRGMLGGRSHRPLAEAAKERAKVS
jgi:hypothetical protein